MVFGAEASDTAVFQVPYAMYYSLHINDNILSTMGMKIKKTLSPLLVEMQ